LILKMMATGRKPWKWTDPGPPTMFRMYASQAAEGNPERANVRLGQRTFGLLFKARAIAVVNDICA
jgi:hypothetical protein